MNEIPAKPTKLTSIPPLKCLVVDDEPMAIEGIINYIGKVDFLEMTAQSTSAIAATEILKTREIDLMFLDINMPTLTGLELLESLDKAPLTIFTTAYSEYALDGFRLNVVDYLMKPIPFRRFFQASQKALEMFQSRLLLAMGGETPVTDMYIRQGDSFLRIVCEDILFVESMQNYLKLHFADKSFIIHQTMSSLEETLPKDSFFRVHKSYLVNVSHITSICGGRIFVGDKELPLSRHRREELMNTVVYGRLISK